ncbi:hypothetical protein D3C72_2309250 [compost metagenome]
MARQRGHGTGDANIVSHIQLHGLSLYAGGSQLIGGRLSARKIAAAQPDRMPLRAQLAGNGKANALVGTGYQRDAV